MKTKDGKWKYVLRAEQWILINFNLPTPRGVFPLGEREGKGDFDKVQRCWVMGLHTAVRGLPVPAR